MALTPSRRSELRAQAHQLSPVVIIGDKGLTDEVMAEIDRSLKAHELIKVRAAAADREARGSWMTAICERLAAHAVQSIGKVLVIYRENFDKPREKKTRDARGETREKSFQVKHKPPKPRSRVSRLASDSSTRTARPRSRTPSPRPESAPRRRRPRSSR
jgi:RNA-binding protein